MPPDFVRAPVLGSTDPLGILPIPAHRSLGTQPHRRMTAAKFITELERRRMLSDRLIARLRASLETYERPMSADDLADFLVQNNHLTVKQASSVLQSLPETVEPTQQKSASELEGASDSSIFGSQIMGGGVMQFAPTPSGAGHEIEPEDEDEDEIRLAPLDEDMSPPAAGKSRPADEEDLPILKLAPNSEETSIERMPEPELEAPRSLVEEEPGVVLTNTKVKRDTTLNGGTRDRAKKLFKDQKKKRPVRKKKRWDSPLILIGGGGLLLLLTIGPLVAWLIYRENGDHILQQASAAAKAGAYAQAIEQYENYLKDFPTHAQHSFGRVQLAILKIRQPTEAGDFPAAIAAATTELKAVEDEDAFKDAHGDIAALLPQIAQGAATAAEKANPTSDEAKKFVDIANQAVALYNNAGYVPKTLRDEGKLSNIQDTLDRVARRQQTHLALTAGLQAMHDAVVAGKPVAAYAAYRKLLQEHPELAGDKSLAAAIQKTTAADQAAVRFVKETKPAETSERPMPWRAALAVANRRVKPAAPVAGVSGVACVHVHGAVFGLDAASGRLLWRRATGFDPRTPPIMVDNDVLICDATEHELQRLDPATGRLVWRQSIGEAFAEPLVADKIVFVPTKSGRLYALDLGTGARTGYLQIGQPINVTPTLDRQKTRIYIPGDEGSLYTVSLADMKCTGVTFLGQSPGSIRVPALAVMDKVAIIENDGVETSRLRLFAIDDKGSFGKQVADRRLEGLAASPPLATGRGLIVATDRGLIEAYEIATGNAANSLSPVATREASRSEPLTRYIALAGRNIWVADTRLTKFTIVASGSQLPVEEIENNFSGDTFDSPLLEFGNLLVHVRRPKDRAGYVVAASDMSQGHPVWETDLAVPPAGAPIVDEGTRSFATATVEGNMFRFDEAAIRSRVQDEAEKTDLIPAEHAALDAAIDLGQGRVALCSAGSKLLLLYNSAQGGGTKSAELESPLACAVTPFGRGLVAPTRIGQVFYLNATDGSRLGTPFQPKLEPQTTLDYQPAVPIGDGKQFVITDSRQKIYLVGLVDQPQPHFEERKQADVGPRPIESPLIVLGDAAIGVAGGTHVVRFRLPTLETAGETVLPAPREAGPFRYGDNLLIGTTDGKLIGLSPAGEIKWQEPSKHGPLAGPPLSTPDGVVVAYRDGTLERRSATDGKPQAATNLGQPLATGPVAFLQHLIVSSTDGTLLVVDKP